MQKRRVLALLCCLCCLCSVLSGPAFAVGEGYQTIDELLQGVDLDEEFTDVLQSLQGIGETEGVEQSGNQQSYIIPVGVGEETGEVEAVVGINQSGEAGIMPASLPYPDSGKNVYIRSSGIEFKKTDNSYQYLTETRNFSKSSSNTYLFLSADANRSSFGNWIMNSSGWLEFSVQNIDIQQSPSVNKVDFAGILSCAVNFNLQTSSYNLVPTSCYLLVNGQKYGKEYTGNFSTGVNITGSYDFSLGNITSLGYRFEFPGWTSSETYLDAWRCELRIGDTVNFSEGQTSVDDVNNSVQEQVAEQQKTNGLLATIKAILDSIANGIGSIVSAISNIVTAITELPGKIWDAIQNGLQLLFVPSTDELDDIYKQFQTLMEERFGFIYQCFSMLDTFFKTVVDGWGNHSEYTFDFPGIEIPRITTGKDGSLVVSESQPIVLVEAQTLDFDNRVFDALRTCAGTIVSLVCVLAVVHAFENMFIAIISGKNYFDYVNSAYDQLESEGLLDDDEKV